VLSQKVNKLLNNNLHRPNDTSLGGKKPRHQWRIHKHS